jgi:glycosyltransferase involved in cell wall biosynthesis
MSISANSFNSPDSNHTNYPESSHAPENRDNRDEHDPAEIDPRGNAPSRGGRPAPLITIVICTYNRAALLPRAVESLRGQTVPEWDCVIIDDGSTDSTTSVAENLVAIDSRFRYYRQPNSGLSLSRNAGILRAQAPLVTFLDSDDEYAAEHLESRLDFMDRNPNTDLLFGGVKVVGGPAFVPDLHDPSKSIPLSECYIGGTFVMKKDSILGIGGFHRPDYGNDFELAQRALKVLNVRHIAAPTYIYHRETPDSMCNLMEKSCRKR